MSRSLHAALAVVAALLLSGCGTPPGLAPVSDFAVVEEPPEPTCAPADTTSPLPPEPAADYRDGATYTC